MLLPSKKTHVSCLTLLGDLAETSLQMTAHPRTVRPGPGTGTGTHGGAGGGGGAGVGEGDVIPIPSAGLSTPMGFPVHVQFPGLGQGQQGQGQGQAGVNGGSPPDMGHFHSQVHTHHQSRWKEDWEELELLVSFFLFCSLG